MPYLTLTNGLGGSVTLNVPDGAFAEREPAMVGERVRMMSGRLASSVVVQKRRWAWDNDPWMTHADRDALEAVIGIDFILTASGDAMRAPTSVVVRIVEDRHIADMETPSDFTHALRLEMEEV
jgi:hypothetical protein